MGDILTAPVSTAVPAHADLPAHGGNRRPGGIHGRPGLCPQHGAAAVGRGGHAGAWDAGRGGVLAGHGRCPHRKERPLGPLQFVHGEEGLEQAVRATEAMRPGQDTRLDAAALEAIARDVPSTSLPRDQVVGRPVVDVVVAAGLQPSKGAVRRLVQNGGLR